MLNIKNIEPSLNTSAPRRAVTLQLHTSLLQRLNKIIKKMRQYFCDVLLMALKMKGNITQIVLIFIHLLLSMKKTLPSLQNMVRTFNY